MIPKIVTANAEVNTSSQKDPSEQSFSANAFVDSMRLRPASLIKVVIVFLQSKSFLLQLRSLPLTSTAQCIKSSLTFVDPHYYRSRLPNGRRHQIHCCGREVLLSSTSIYR